MCCSHNTQTTTYEDPRKNKIEDVPHLPSFHHSATADDVMTSLRNAPLRLDAMWAIVTGANSGIGVAVQERPRTDSSAGYEVARALALNGVTVVMGCRSHERLACDCTWLQADESQGRGGGGTDPQRADDSSRVQSGARPWRQGQRPCICR